MADGIALGNHEQQHYAYQAQVNASNGQYYTGAEQHHHHQQQLAPEQIEQDAQVNQSQDVNYAQYTQSGAELANGQQVVGGVHGVVDQQHAGIIQQYAGATGQLSQQQGSNGYKINFDPNPQIIRKNANDAVTYKQEVAVRYLRPPTPPPPGPLIIKEVRNPALPAAPPIVIRQRPPRPATPPPLVIRERPPQPPAQLPPKVLTKPLPPPPPPPRRVIIERMPPLPPKPQSIIVERWLPYKQQKRRVVYQKAPPVQPPAPQKNLIIQWEGTQARVVKEFRNLGIVKADPNSYVQQYGTQLRPTQGLPDFIKGLPTPNLGPEYTAGANPDQIDPALLAGTVDPSLASNASPGVIPFDGLAGFAQENIQYAQPGTGLEQVGGEQQVAYAAYQQSAYSQGSTVEGQQFAAEQQQGPGFVQNLQYQQVPQYAPVN